MKRNTSLIASGFLTVLIVIVIMTVNLMGGALAQGGGSEATSPVAPPATPLPPAEVTATATTQDGALQAYQQQATEVEKQYQTQIDGLTKTLEKLDSDYGTQLQSLQDQLAVAETKNAELDEQIATAQATVDELQATLTTMDETFQTELATLTTTAQQEEASLRAQVESLYTDLQMAYNEISNRQAAAAAAAVASYNPPPSNSGGNSGSYTGDDDHGDDDHGGNDDDGENEHDDD